MSKALLIGPAPCLEEQLSKVDINDYGLICGINHYYKDKMLEIFEKNNVKITHHYFSDYLYRREASKINDLKIDKKILIAPYPHMVPRVTKDIQICPDSVVQTINHLGGYLGDTWATTGMYSLGHLVYSLRVEYVKICGFTFGEGKLHLYDDTKLDLSRHKIDKERQIYNFLHKKGKCST